MAPGIPGDHSDRPLLVSDPGVSMRLSRIAALAVLALWVALGITPLAAQAPAARTLAPAATVAAFRDLLQTRYVTPIDSATLARATTMEQLLTLVSADPFTDVFSPERWRQFTAGSGQAFGGIGATLGSIRDSLVIGGLLEDAPAALAGLRPRDRLVSIDDSVAVGWSLSQAVNHLRGPLGTPVTVGVVRDGVPVGSVRLVRASVQVPSVTAASVTSHGLGVVTISQFGPELTTELSAVIGRLQRRGMRALILDLRANPGGLLDEAVRAANLFLPQGSLVVETRYRGEAPERHVAEETTTFPSMPLAILVGPETASAAEILAGALQDSGRAVVVGQQSYGKGLVQSSRPLPEGWVAKFTVGRWYTPSGRLIDRGQHAREDSTEVFDPTAPHSGGILPDVVSQDSVEAAAAAAFHVMGNRTRAIMIALDDEVGAFLRTHPKFPPGLDPVTGSSASVWQRLGSMADSLDAGTRASLQPWLDAELARRAVDARYGSWASTIWQYSRDPMMDAAAGALAERLAVGM